MAESVDALDLKSNWAYNPVPVQVWPGAILKKKTHLIESFLLRKIVTFLIFDYFRLKKSSKCMLHHGFGCQVRIFTYVKIRIHKLKKFCNNIWVQFRKANIKKKGVQNL